MVALVLISCSRCLGGACWFGSIRGSISAMTRPMRRILYLRWCRLIAVQR